MVSVGDGLPIHEADLVLAKSGTSDTSSTWTATVAISKETKQAVTDHVIRSSVFSVEAPHVIVLDGVRRDA